MTARSNANTSGLEVVAWLTPGGDVTCSEAYAKEQSVNDPDNYPSALVTAASAQARIDAAEARADRLAKALETLEAERNRDGVNLAHLKRAVAVAYADMNRAALQQETQP